MNAETIAEAHKGEGPLVTLTAAEFAVLLGEIRGLREAALAGLAIAMVHAPEETLSVEQMRAALNLLEQNSWLGRDETPPLRFVLDRVWPGWLGEQTGAAEVAGRD